MSGQQNNERKFIGFNQVWMGCPQPLCLQGGIDAIIKEEGFEENSLNIKIFRGKYYWEIGNYSEPPLVENAKLISETFKGLEPPIDAAFTTWALYPIFFKGNKRYTFRFDAIVEDINKSYKGLSNDANDMNAVMYWDRGSIDNEFLIIFKNDRVWALRNSEVMDGWPKNISSVNNNFPTDISAAFVDYNDNAFIFKDYYFYTFKADYFETNLFSNLELRPKLIFQDFFHCNNSFYAEWGFGSYNRFVSEFYSKSQIVSFVNTSASTLERININLNQTEKNEPKLIELNWMFVLIVIAIIVIFSVIGVLVLICFISKIKKKSYEREKIESLAVLRPLMNENGNHLEIIAIEDIPRKTKIPNTRPKRTKFSDEAYG